MIPSATLDVFFSANATVNRVFDKKHGSSMGMRLFSNEFRPHRPLRKYFRCVFSARADHYENIFDAFFLPARTFTKKFSLDGALNRMYKIIRWLGLGRPGGAQRPQKVDKNPKISENFQTLPNASERIRMHPNASEQVRMGPNRSEHVQKLRKTCKNWRNFAKVSKTIAQWAAARRPRPSQSAGRTTRYL